MRSGCDFFFHPNERRLIINSPHEINKGFFCVFMKEGSSLIFFFKSVFLNTAPTQIVSCWETLEANALTLCVRLFKALAGELFVLPPH